MMLFLCQHNCNYIIKKKKFFFICIFIRVTVQTGYFQPGQQPGQNQITRMEKQPGSIRVDPDEPETDRSTNLNYSLLRLMQLDVNGFGQILVGYMAKGELIWN